MGGGYYPTNACEGLAAGAAFISFINVFGGFIVTARQVYTILAWEPSVAQGFIVSPADYPQLVDFTGKLNFSYKSRPTQLRIIKSN